MKRRLKHLVPPKLSCPVCGTSFTPAPVKNYQYNRLQKYCSKECQHRVAVEKQLKTLAAKRKAEEAKQKAEAARQQQQHNKFNLYRHVHEFACSFAGLDMREFSVDE